MKLHRFKAINTQKAMQKIHEVLGREALIYSTKTTVEGVEVIAGLPYAVEECEVEELAPAKPASGRSSFQEEQPMSHELLGKMQQQLEQVQRQIQDIARRINTGVTGMLNNLSSMAAYEPSQMSYHFQIGEVAMVEDDNILQIFPHIDVSTESIIEDTLKDDEEDVIKRAEIARSNWEKNRKKRQRWG